MPKGKRAAPELRAEVIRLRDEGVPRAEITERLGVSLQSVSRWAPTRNGSGRARILASLVDDGPARDLDELARRVPDVDRHNAVHLLHSLKRAGLVRFDENGRGPRAIEVTAVGLDADHEPVPVDVVITPEGTTTGTLRADDVLVPDQPTYPLIRALVERASLLHDAARLLERAGMDELALQALAKVDDLSPLDREVIALAMQVGLVDDL